MGRANVTRRGYGFTEEHAETNAAIRSSTVETSGSWTRSSESCAPLLHGARSSQLIGGIRIVGLGHDATLSVLIGGLESIPGLDALIVRTVALQEFWRL